MKKPDQLNSQPVDMKIRGFQVQNIRWTRESNGRGDIHYSIPRLFGCQGSLQGVELPPNPEDQVTTVRAVLDRYLSAFEDMADEDNSDPVLSLARDIQEALRRGGSGSDT